MEQNVNVVDLGLPSGTLWAKCNIGANTETDYGKYFMWGDIVGRTADEVKDKPYNWDTTPFNNGLNKFVNSDGILLPKHDAAFMNTHGLMKMPTREQFEELIENTTVTWKENFNGSGVNGRKFTSKKDSSKYIFIPAAGFASNGSLYSVDSYGYVWSSSLYPSYPSNAWELYFHSGGMGVGYSARFVGHNIRGVNSK